MNSALDCNDCLLEFKLLQKSNKSLTYISWGL